MSLKQNNIIDKNKKSAGLIKASDAMNDMVKKLLGSHSFIEIDIIKNWERIVGEDLAEISVPQKIDFKKGSRDEGVLTLMVVSGGFALELSQNERVIVEKINTYFGYKAVEKIKIMQTGTADFFKTGPKFADIEKKKLVTQKEQNYIDGITKDVESEELKNRLASLAEKVMATQNKEN